ncbi:MULTISPECIES: helix-turn-helix domain-containing protein [unclassified Gluconobacter]|uniref:helix-turn-helix domain-containing protein n=1 Tax=unclassified Gluconobacter TaxID=2644261 RepID=UPI001C048A60|nr:MULTISPECIES: helix-turn-helix transcriptional regulator [unclassified Gluconobacter]
MRPNHGSQLVHYFARNLKTLREARGLSQEALAGKAGLDRTYVSSCERGERNVTLVTLDRLSVALGVLPHSLLDKGSSDE